MTVLKVFAHLRERRQALQGTRLIEPYDAFAVVAGAVALLREYLRKRKRIANPSSALLKALLTAGAERLPGTQDPQLPVDNDQGFGCVNWTARCSRWWARTRAAGCTPASCPRGARRP